MSKSKLFNKDIIRKIKNKNEAQIVQPVQVNRTEKENELVFFFKPELLVVEDPKKLQASLDLVAEKFKEFDVTVSGAAIVPGAVLEKYEIMNRHYGFINQLSRKASKIVDEDTRAKIFEKLMSIEFPFTPKNKHLFNEFGIKLRKAGMLQEALQWYCKALECCSMDPHLYYNLGRVHYEMAKPEVAVQNLEAALNIEPDLIPAEKLLEAVRKSMAGNDATTAA
ncbi:MAG: tetratricopeptide repeat protein [Brevefilum sp.]